MLSGFYWIVFLQLKNYRNQREIKHLNYLKQQYALFYILEPINNDFLFVETYGTLFDQSFKSIGIQLKGLFLTQLDQFLINANYPVLGLNHKLLELLKTGQPFVAVHDLPGNQTVYTIYSKLSDVGQPDRISGIVIEISEQKQIERNLRTQHQQVLAILDHVVDVYFICNMDLIILEMSEGMRNYLSEDELEILKTSPFSNLDVAQEFAQELVQIIAHVVHNRESHTLEKFSKKLNLWLEITVIPFKDEIIFGIRNITSRKEEQIALERMSQLDLLGNMAAAIAHEIRNPITTVSGFIQLLSKDPKWSVYSHLNLMLSEIQRADRIISDFLALSKSKVVQRLPMDLNLIIHSLVPLMESYAFLHKQHLRMELNKDVPTSLLNDAEIRQMVLNLVRNGFESMDENGEIVIRTGIDDLSGRIELIISDQGHGIDPTIMDKITLPLFTTKNNGTGLGLSVCQRIAERHDAELNWTSTAQGTTVRLLIPIHQIPTHDQVLIHD